jgi:phosphoserine phosphatase RsbU/P
LVGRLTRFYYGTAAGIVFLMNGYNLWIDGSSLRHIFQFDFYFVLSAVLLITGFLHVYSMYRLRPVSALLESRLDRSREEELSAFDILTRFPREVFISVWAASLLFSAVYHSLEILWFRIRPFNELVFRHLIIEMIFGAALSFVFMEAVRAMLRSLVRKLNKIDALPAEGRTFVVPWTAAFSTVLLLTVIPQLWFIRNEAMREDRPEVLAIIALSGVALLFGAFIMQLLFGALKNEIERLTEAIRKLADINPLTHSRKLSVGSRDEIGQLASLFNELQAKSAKEHGELQNDLRLAAAVQRMLLPQKRHIFEGLVVECRYETAKEVGGDFYDCLKLLDGRIAILFGEVSGKGLPASLVMTATLMLLRKELRDGGRTGEIITRLNRDIADTANGTVLVNLGLAIIDSSARRVEYASSGQTAPFLLRSGEARLLSVSSLPLGAAPDTVYESLEWEHEEGDKLFFYTSGLMEHFRHSPEGNGFQTLQRLLEQLPPDLPIRELMERIWTYTLPPLIRPEDKMLLIADFTVPDEREGLFYA